MNPIIKKFQYGNQTVTLETGRVARQATGAVVVTMGETAVLCTALGNRTRANSRLSDDSSSSTPRK